MLAALSGRVHRVLTAVALQAGPRRFAALSVSRVRFAAMTPAQIAAYVASGEPLGKAGAYGVQGRAAAFIAQLAGSYSGIMGLPLYETAQLLRDMGFEL
jgi:septum formation protein